MSSSSNRSLKGLDSTSASGSASRRDMASLPYRVDRIEKDAASDAVANKSVINSMSFMLVLRYSRIVFW